MRRLEEFTRQPATVGRSRSFATYLQFDFIPTTRMAPGIRIDLADGSLKLPALALVIRRGTNPMRAEAMHVESRNGAVDHGNGYAWSNFRALTFGGMPCALALGFRQGALSEAHLEIALPDVKLEGGWPTRQAIDEEIAFARKVFRDHLGREFGDKPEQFKWGVAWSGFDPKGFMATAGVR